MDKKIIIDGVEYTAKEEEKEEIDEEKNPEPDKEAEEEEGIEEKIQKATDEVVKSLKLDELKKSIEDLTKSVSKGAPEHKVSALLDLEELMKKDVTQMTAKEKIIGFFQAMIQNNDAVLKALSEGTAADGGYLFPDEFRAEVIRDLAEGGYMRNEVTVIPMKRDIMKIPGLTSRPKVTWTEENTTKNTTTAAFTEHTLTVKKMAAILYASDELVEDSTEIDVVNFIITLFSEAIGQEEDRVIVRGNGTTEPTGFITAVTATTIASVVCVGNLSFDNILTLIYTLPAKYHKSAKFLVHRNNIAELRKLKDSNNRYYWQEPVAAGLPPTIYGYPVLEQNDMPEATIIFGDLKKAYWLGDRKKMTVKVTQDTETALNSEGSIKGVNFWEVPFGLWSPFGIIRSQAIPAMV